MSRARISLAAVRTIRRLDAALEALDRCPTCGKSRSVRNVNLAGYQRGSNASRFARPERVAAETHCACPGGPAAPRATKRRRSAR